MRERSFGEPADYVIWLTSGLLSLLLGLGASFVLWVALHHSAQVVLARGAVGALGAGLFLIGLAMPKPLTSAFLALFSIMLVVGFTLGGPQFARLLP
jgi:hypothetical protein